jgi:hypothetical protein
MSDTEPRFGAEDVIAIASRLGADNASFIVGGQATNLWAWYYRDRSPDLQFDEPLTSLDIDYFGTFRVAHDFAAAIGGRVLRPDADTMNSPNTAIVLAEYQGKPLLIDFLNGILGVTLKELETGVAVILVEADMKNEARQVEIAVLHPVLCLRSRVQHVAPGHPSPRSIRVAAAPRGDRGGAVLHRRTARCRRLAGSQAVFCRLVPVPPLRAHGPASRD